MVGRKKEKEELLRAYASAYSEFVAIYGRRRVGKTFLVREAFNYSFTFQHSGVKDKPTVIQLDRFRQSLAEQGYPECPELKNWFKAFDVLKLLINRNTSARKVVFIDEMPWLDRPNANFVSALENFWNGWASARKDILLIVCGSASSWILKKVVHNKEGLHNRVTYRIPLRPFTLKECEEYARELGLEYTHAQLAECYMILGGIPYYWHYLERGKSVAQNMDELFFSGNDKLENEFEELYESLFRSAEPYVKIVTALGTKKIGMVREALSRESGLLDNGKLTEYLADLERCGFIRKYTPRGKVSKGTVYQLMDNFTLFYFRFILPNHGIDRHYWTKMRDTPVHSAWAGLAFERLCLEHIEGIKRALGISGVLTNEHAWYSKAAQIDLLIDRNDGIINICEMKFAADEYVIDRNDDENMRRKRSALKTETGTRKAIHVTYVTTYGLKYNAYANDVQSQVLLDDLFA